MPAPADRGLAFQHDERGVDRRVVRVAHLPRDLRVAEREQQRHRLRRTERRVDPRNLRHRPTRGERLTRERVGMRQHAMQRLGAHLAIETQPRGTDTEPPARRFLPARVVLLGTPGNGVEVVLLLPRSKLPETQHAPTPIRGVCEWSGSTTGASASSFLGCSSSTRNSE